MRAGEGCGKTGRQRNSEKAGVGNSDFFQNMPRWYVKLELEWKSDLPGMCKDMTYTGDNRHMKRKEGENSRRLSGGKYLALKVAFILRTSESQPLSMLSLLHWKDLSSNMQLSVHEIRGYLYVWGYGQTLTCAFSLNKYGGEVITWNFIYLHYSSYKSWLVLPQLRKQNRKQYPCHFQIHCWPYTDKCNKTNKWMLTQKLIQP